MNAFTENLFSYGTLQQEDVQLGLFNRLLEGEQDAIGGCVVTTTPILDQDVVESSGETHYRNVTPTGNESDVVEGTVYKVSIAELELADEYEAGADYLRRKVQLRSGLIAWVYSYR